jgi:hypothetical protein
MTKTLDLITIGLDHAFFQPLWIRIVVVTVCFGWAAFEFATGRRSGASSSRGLAPPWAGSSSCQALQRERIRNDFAARQAHQWR